MLKLLSMLPLFDYELFLEAWKTFITQQIILPEVNPYIANSWKRCWARLNPHRPGTLRSLRPEHLLATQVASFDLLSLARPVMEDTYQYLEGSDTAIVLTNSPGYVLDMLGDAEMLEILAGYGIVPGVLLSEMEMGTNALSLAIQERSPVRVAGAEHYLQTYHELAEAAAPIFDLSGRPLGALGIFNLFYRHHPHSLGLVVSAAKAIEGQRQADFLMAEQNSQLAQLNAIVEASSDGLVVLDEIGTAMHVNETATCLLGLERNTILGRSLRDVIEYPAFLGDAIRERQALENVETILRVGDQQVNCLISLNFVLRQEMTRWIIVTFKPGSGVRELVQQQVGAQAPLTQEDIPGDSPAIRRVQRFIKVAAPAQASILIRGESGTGKNVLASAIHNASPRRDGPFLIFGCTSIPHEWVISELLGYDESVESKRLGGRPSKFELAHHGTLFFQNVDDLPLEAQSILLNVLDLGIVQRLGSERPIEVDVRVFASTTANIEKLIAQGNFRADLYYRLSAFEITLPPLRERMQDLGVLIERILSRLHKQLASPLELEPGVMDLLKTYSWPGNVRELEAVLGRAAVQCGPAAQIGLIHLPAYLQQPPGKDKQAGSGLRPIIEVERESILSAAQACKGNVSAMAKALGLGRTTVWRRLKEMEIDVDVYRYNRGD